MGSFQSCKGSLAEFLKFFCLILQLVVSGSAYSQTRLGSSFSQISKEFEDGFEMKFIPVEGKWDQISILTSEAYVHYSFNDDGICTLVAVMPFNEKILKEYIELYNSTYVIKSPRKWWWYPPGGICQIELISEQGQNIFIWSIIED